MTDVAPALLEAITDEVTQGIGDSSKIQSVLALIQNGKATHADSLFYARETGEILAKAFKTNLSSAVLPDGRMYYNIAKRILEPTLTNNHNLVADVATEVQSILNEQAGIGLKAIRPAVNQSGIDSIVNKISRDMPFDNVAWMLQDPIVRFSEHVVDETIQENVEFIGESGIATTITRTTDFGACEWCRAVAGTYTYPNIPNDVYRRHDNCHCLVVSETDKTKKVIHSGKEGKRKYEKGEISEKYQLTEEERIKRLKEREATAEERAKAARQKRIETWERKKQRKEPAEKLRRIAENQEPQVTNDLMELSKQTGSEMVGLEFRLKTVDSLARKIETNPDAKIRDVLRYTNISDGKNQVDNYFKVVEQLEEKGYSVSRVKNYWKNTNNPYNGINTNIITPSGYEFELQFHTKESFELKNGKLHELYETQRLIKDKRSAEYIKLNDEMFELSNSLKVPEQISKVE